MQIKTAAAITSLALTFLATSAQAELQTWRLTSISYHVQEGFTPPAFAEVGNVFSIDYVIDTQTPSAPGWNGMFSGSVKSFSINGITSLSEGYIAAWGGGLNAINIWPSTGRTDGIDFISFNHFGGNGATSVSSALAEFSLAASTNAVDLRIDFGDKSVWAKPSSFAVSAVPEPSCGLLLLGGLLTVLFRKSCFRRIRLAEAVATPHLRTAA
ncbi:hypothetical protein [Aquabacterium sp.]|uniref:hypothetical protein n=1 Tax=Aquabacterium sp. TaxID=1872578 RepID=UPI002E3402B3|nr:hypothetical protein [Aquabacterium sp.]HEX5310801.1 hypothetical protein [Aquabacterium sp.]